MALTYACVSCGGLVAADARRCPHCGGKRPAPTVANVVRTLIALAVVVVLLVALFGGFKGSSGAAGSAASPTETQAALARLDADDGACLSQAGVSTVGAAVQVQGGVSVVTLADGAEFTVPVDGGPVVDANPQADRDVLSGNADC